MTVLVNSGTKRRAVLTRRKPKQKAIKAKRSNRKLNSLRTAGLKRRRYKNRKKKRKSDQYLGVNLWNNRIIVYIPFNNLNVRANLPKYILEETLPEENTHLTEEWINNRISIFMNFTLKSLLNQTNPNYLAFIVYHDSSKQYIENALQNYPPLPFNIKFVSSSEYESEVKSTLAGYNYFYELHLYSDDMYRRDYIEYLYHYKPKVETKVLICQNGYIYNSNSNQLAKYFNFSSSFNCLIYNVNDYIKGVRHNLFSPSALYGIWTGAIRLPHEIIKEPFYINHSHKANSAFFYETEIKNNWIKDVWTNNKGKLNLFGELITDETEKQRILEEFFGPLLG
jgi:hypothetical protein